MICYFTETTLPCHCLMAEPIFAFFENHEPVPTIDELLPYVDPFPETELLLSRLYQRLAPKSLRLVLAPFSFPALVSWQ